MFYVPKLSQNDFTHLSLTMENLMDFSLAKFRNLFKSFFSILVGMKKGGVKGIISYTNTPHTQKNS